MLELRQTDPVPTETSFDAWVGGRKVQSIGTNAGSNALPFQNWRNFKEAFAPELIKRAISDSDISVRTCLDPFGGSGTTALACQFLGVRPTTVEVNPYLADLIEAKLCTYDVRTLAKDFAKLIRAANRTRVNPRALFAEAPVSFVEPGHNNRWLFDLPVAKRLASYVSALSAIQDQINRRLFRVLLGGVLVEVSNVVVSGKGRRYRRNWDSRLLAASDLDEAFCSAVENAIDDIICFGSRAERRYRLLRADARTALTKGGLFDLAVFSPPYPNSFDYTDVYNVELWGLRYLSKSIDNRRLRMATLTSHVQVKRQYATPVHQSKRLKRALVQMRDKKSELWNPDIPDMVAGYFADMERIMNSVYRRLASQGKAWMVVGDSRYAGVRVPVAAILCEIATNFGFQVVEREPFRSMRSSAQQGGQRSPDETLLVLRRTCR